MNINIKFIDESTVNINASLDYWGSTRPPRHLKKVCFIEDVINEFKKKHPSYEVESADGPDSFFNFKTKELSHGSWLLKVSKKQKKAPTKTTTKKSSTKTTIKKGD